METKARKTVSHGVETVEDITPTDYVVIDTYRPHSTPWDYHGMKHQRDVAGVLTDAGIESVKLQTRQRTLKPHGGPGGSGPGGRVQFGDNMMPGVFRVAVRKSDEPKALQALVERKQAVEQWLYHNGPAPKFYG